MSGKQIFKMELYKFINEKAYIVSAGVLGILNFVATLLLLNLASNDFYTDYSSIIGSIILIFSFVIIGNWVFAFIYPFHILSIDYKNNVMAMMISSGVNRTKLFFCKIGAVLICTFTVTVAISILPFLLLVAKLTQEVGFQYLIHEITSVFMYGLLDFSGFQLIILGILMYINMLVLIATASILLKGNNLTFLVFIGFNLIFNTISRVLMTIPDTFNFGSNGYVFFQILVYLLSICAFGFISLNTLKKQNL